jgi:hypothetical protein
MMKFAAAPGDESADGSPPKINIVLNLFEELKIWCLRIRDMLS